MRPSQNLPLPSRLYPLFQQLYSTLPESTPPSQNILPFSTTIILCDRPRIYPSPPEYTPRFSNYYIMRPFRNLPLPPRVYLLFNKYNIMRPSQNVPLPPKIYPLFQQLYIYNLPRIYPFLPEYTPFSTTRILCCQNLSLPPRIYLPFNHYMRHSQNLPLPPPLHPSQNISLLHFLQLHPIFQESTPQSLNMSPFLETTCTCEKI